MFHYFYFIIIIIIITIIIIIIFFFFFFTFYCGFSWINPSTVDSRYLDFAYFE